MKSVIILGFPFSAHCIRRHSEEGVEMIYYRGPKFLFTHS